MHRFGCPARILAELFQGPVGMHWLGNSKKYKQPSVLFSAQELALLTACAMMLDVSVICFFGNGICAAFRGGSYMLVNLMLKAQLDESRSCIAIEEC